MRSRLMLIGILVFTLVSCVCGMALCSTIRVATTGSDGNDGSSWANAKQTIGAALTAASSGDAIWVKSGTYSGYTSTLILKQGVNVYGGFAGTEASLQERVLDTQTPSVISGASMNSSVVKAPTGVTNATVFDGFTLTGGTGTQVSSVLYGGGIYVAGTGLTISNCRLDTNSATRGGGIFAVSGAITNIHNCTVTGNSATNGAGIYFYNGECLNSVVTGNVTGCSYGGGIEVGSHGDCLIQGTEVSHNTCSLRGGGIFIDTLGTPAIEDCDVHGNKAKDFGGGICASASSPVITNCEITSNQLTDSSTSARGGAGIAGTSSSTQLIGCNIESNSIDDSANTIGAGAYFSSGTPIVTGNTIHDNDNAENGSGLTFYLAAAFTAAENVIDGNDADPNSTSKGGGVAIYGTSTGTFDRNRVYSNTAASKGGGIYFNSSYATATTVTSNLIYSNSATEGGGVYVQQGKCSLNNNTIVKNSSDGVYVMNMAGIAATLSNNIVALNVNGVKRYNTVPSVTLNYNNVQGNTGANYVNINDPTGSNGNISSDPSFTNATNDDYSLQSGSPCREGGDNSVVASGATDVVGNNRRIVTVDIGAYESLASDTTAPASGAADSPTTVQYSTSHTIEVTYSGVGDEQYGSGLLKVELWYKLGAGGTWTNTNQTRDTISGSFTFTPPGGGGTYYLDVVAEDAAANRSSAASGDGDTCTDYQTYQLTLEQNAPAPPQPWFVLGLPTVVARATDSGVGLSGHRIYFTRTRSYLAGYMLSETVTTNGTGYAVSMDMGSPALEICAYTAVDLDHSDATTTLQVQIYGVDLQADSNNDGVISDPYPHPWDTADEAVEITAPGLVIPINDDDDNQNSTADKDEPVPPATTVTIEEEDDLWPVNLRCSAPASNYTVTLKFSLPTGSNKPARIWSDRTKGTLLVGNGDNDSKTYAADAVPGIVYVEGVVGGQTTLDMILKDPSGNAVASDQIIITVRTVKIDSPATAAPTSTTPEITAYRVLISKHNYVDPWPSTCQTENRKIRITASVNPPAQGVKIYFKNWDYDDQSPYEPLVGYLPDRNWGDNKDEAVGAGSLSIPNEYPDEYTGGTEGGFTYVYTNASGIAKVDLQITDHCAGDNYIVTANPGPSNALPKPDWRNATGNLVAWKRVYVENDAMFRVGCYLASDFTHDTDLFPDTIEVEEGCGSLFHDGEDIMIVDALSHQEVTIMYVEGDLLRLWDDIDDDYRIGYTGEGRGAAVGSLEAGFFWADPGEVHDAFGDPGNVGGTDGGTFVEFWAYTGQQAGSGVVPYEHELNDETSPSMIEFQHMWFAHQNQYNNVWLLGADVYSQTQNVLGWTPSGLMTSCVYVGKIESFPELTENSVRFATVHELGHVFDLSWTDYFHADNHCHLGPQDSRCVMDYASTGYTPETTTVEFCWDDINHLLEVRKQADPLVPPWP